MFTSSRGRYQRVGSPVSNSTSGRSDSASVSPSSVTFTCRELRFTSMRWNGSRGWPITGSSSSSHSSRASKWKATRPWRRSMPASGSG